jgi:hypothetical protein
VSKWLSDGGVLRGGLFQEDCRYFFLRGFRRALMLKRG